MESLWTLRSRRIDADGVVDLFGRPICPWLRWLPRLARQHGHVVLAWSRRGVAAVAALGRLGLFGWRSAARQRASWLSLAVPAAPSAVRRSAASVPTSLPPSPGSRTHGTDDGRREAGHRRRRGVLTRRLLRPLLRLRRRAARPGGRAAGGGPGQPGCKDVTRFGPGSRVTAGPARAATRRRRRRRGVLAVVPPRAAAVPPQCSARGKAGHASAAAFRCPSSPNLPKFPILPPPAQAPGGQGPPSLLPPPPPPGPRSTQVVTQPPPAPFRRRTIGPLAPSASRLGICWDGGARRRRGEGPAAQWPAEETARGGCGRR